MMTHSEVATALGMSIARVKAIESKALSKLRALAVARGLDPGDFIERGQSPIGWMVDNEPRLKIERP